MKKEIIVKDKKIKYFLKNSLRAKNLRLTIRKDKGLIVTKPRFVPLFYVEKFIIKKSSWIFSKLELIKSANNVHGSRKDYLENKEKARKIILEKVKYFNKFYKFNYKNIRIKNQRTLWGSCSQGGNLNFNYKLVHQEDLLIDYVVVHELCHLGELNHSVRFWALVQKRIPNYKIIRKRLKKIH